MKWDNATSKIHLVIHYKNLLTKSTILQEWKYWIIYQHIISERLLEYWILESFKENNLLWPSLPVHKKFASKKYNFEKLQNIGKLFLYHINFVNISDYLLNRKVKNISITSHNFREELRKIKTLFDFYWIYFNSYTSF